MMKTRHALLAAFLVGLSSQIYAQVFDVTQTVLGDRKLSSSVLPKEAIENRTPESRRAWEAKYRKDYRATYQLFRGTTASGLRALYYDVPDEFDYDNIGARRVVIFGPGGTLVTAKVGMWLDNRGAYYRLAGPLGELILSSRWNDKSVKVGVNGRAETSYAHSMSTTCVWKQEGDQLVFRQFRGADVDQRIVAITTTTLDRTKGTISYTNGWGKELERFEFEMIDSKPVSIPNDIVKIGTPIFDQRAQFQRRELEPWNGNWPKVQSAPLAQTVTNNSTTGVALQGLAVTGGICLLLGGVFSLLRKRSR